MYIYILRRRSSLTGFLLCDKKPCVEDAHFLVFLKRALYDAQKSPISYSKEPYMMPKRVYFILKRALRGRRRTHCVKEDSLQPIADRVAQNLEIMSKIFQFSTRRTV